MLLFATPHTSPISNQITTKNLQLICKVFRKLHSCGDFFYNLVETNSFRLMAGVEFKFLNSDGGQIKSGLINKLLNKLRLIMQIANWLKEGVVGREWRVYQSHCQFADMRISTLWATCCMYSCSNSFALHQTNDFNPSLDESFSEKL